jgi:hypothetical protein
MTRETTPKDDDKYLSAVLKLYLNLAETPSRASPDDRKTAAELHTRGVPLASIESAFLLASVRRLSRSPDMPPLSPIRSLAYFFPVIQEVLANPIPENYLEYLRIKAALLSRTGIHIKSGQLLQKV